MSQDVAHWLSGLGLAFDLIGVVLLGIAANVRRQVLERSQGTLRPQNKPSLEEKRTLGRTEKPGWILVAVGFLLQLVGVLVSP